MSHSRGTEAKRVGRARRMSATKVSRLSAKKTLEPVLKVVVSTTLDRAEWRNSTLIKDNVVEQVRALKAQDGKNILLDGSSVLVHTLIQHDLVDEYHLLVYPLVLGGGKKLFPDGMRVNLRLVEARPLPSGVTLMRYVPDQPA